jgi:2-polyprenyl-3-methyl-5-hydroxy-6-metoxy-1,4-benzoquinol methylase
MGKTLYNELAHYYDLTDGNKSDDIEFYSRLANECEGPILDYGCGSGRLTIALAQEGHVIYATDPSLELVKIMRYQLSKQPDFIQERVHIIGLEEVENIPCVSLIILAYNTFNEITDIEQQ